MLKAYHIYDGDPRYSSLLVFAETRGKAKMLAFHAGLYEYEQFVDLTARRAKAWDGALGVSAVVDENRMIPEEYPRFYSDGEED